MSNATARFWAGLGIGIGVCALLPFQFPFWGAIGLLAIAVALLLSSREAAMSERHPYPVSMSCGHQIVAHLTKEEAEELKRGSETIRFGYRCSSCLLEPRIGDWIITIRTLAKEVGELADELDSHCLHHKGSLRAEAARELLRRMGLA